jgi:hypothetical protein
VHPVDHVVAHVHRVGVSGQHFDLKAFLNPAASYA